VERVDPATAGKPNALSVLGTSRSTFAADPIRGALGASFVAASVSPSTGRFDKLKVPSLSRGSGP